jgi:glycosyltransferase involved in cell wall biosynthesis
VLFLAFRDSKNPAAVGGDFYLWELAKGLAKMGHKITVVCSSFEGAKPKETVEGVTIIRIKNSWRLSFDVLKIYLGKLKGNFDVIVEEAIGGQRLPFFSALYSKEPLISVWHQKNRKIFFEQYPFLLALVLSVSELMQAKMYKNKMIITPSKGAKRELLTMGFKFENVKVVYDGVKQKPTVPKPKESREETIVWLGKLRRYKRPDHVIMALPQVIKDAKTPINLIIAGKVSEFDTNYLKELTDLAENLGVAKNVVFKLNISEQEKADLLSNARVLVQPSPVEGFSIVVMEANLQGTPVVASSGVPKDVVIENFNGLVYQYGAIDNLSSAITKLFKDDLLWQKLSENSAMWAQNFTWEKSATNLQQIMQELVEK